MRTLDPEINALRALDRDALIERYRSETGREPRRRNVPWLFRRLAWRIQEKRLGGLSATARTRLDQLMSEIQIPLEPSATTTGRLSRRSGRNGLTIGSSVERDYKGDRVVLRVVEDGFEVDGIVHRSLSAAASAAIKNRTGASQHVNGRLWWGLVTRRTAT